MAHQRAFYFRRAESVASDIKNIINPPDDPEIAVLIASRAVSGKIISLELAPILFFVALLVAATRAQHWGPGSPNNQVSAYFWADLAPLLSDHDRIDRKTRDRCATGLCWNRARQGRNQHRCMLS